MEKFYWLAANVITFILATTGYLYMSSGTDSANLQISPLSPPVVLSVNRENVEIVTTNFTSSKEAYSSFLLQFHGASLAPFYDVKLEKLGFKGYFAWYDGTLATHAVLWRSTTVIVISYIDINVSNTQDEKLLLLENYIIDYLKDKDGI